MGRTVGHECFSLLNLFHEFDCLLKVSFTSFQRDSKVMRSRFHQLPHARERSMTSLMLYIPYVTLQVPNFLGSVFVGHFPEPVLR